MRRGFQSLAICNWDSTLPDEMAFMSLSKLNQDFAYIFIFILVKPW